ncbi:hypothetical protein E0L36_08690 [Streptomyces sp. AJS327]|uniref:hypothetical protein n=1 Tax=Streptomyces sp. AJS327 TaxID=2545265 RepID=UPI0015DF6B6F|nr:hypothetical protein [Streptomyces sp. AJS327]MBA0050968.1 hypothetical protein [Streptomyces sp. AJS327]
MRERERRETAPGGERAPAAPVRGAEPAGRAARHAVTGGPAALTPHTVRVLQQAAGNAAVSAAVGGRAPVQRAGGTGGEAERSGAAGRDGTARPTASPGQQARAAGAGTVQGVGATGDPHTVAGGASVETAQTPGVPHDFLDPTTSTDSSYAAGIGGPFASMLPSAVAAGTSAVTATRALREDRSEGAGVRGQEAGSTLRTAGAETAQSGSAFLGQAASGAGGAMNLAGQNVHDYHGVLAGGAGAALVTGTIQAGRYARKAVRARERVRELEAAIERLSAPDEVLREAEKEVGVRQELVSGLQFDIDVDELYIQRLEETLDEMHEQRHTPEVANLDSFERAGRLEQLRSLTEALHTRRAEVDRRRDELTVAKRELAEARERAVLRQRVRAAIEEAVADVERAARAYESGESREISMVMIQRYALKKNQHGYWKKVVAAVSGATGAAGSVATLVATIAVAAGATAGATALFATPVGWALAGVAAGAGMTLGAYKAWRFFAQRWYQTSQPSSDDGALGTLKHLGRTLAFWEGRPRKERKEYAEALFRYAEDEVWGEQAQFTLTALGLRWEELRGDRAAAVERIARKMAS